MIFKRRRTTGVSWQHSPALPDTVEQLRQGDVLGIYKLPVMWHGVAEVECALGAVVVSQSCDATRKTVFELQVSPIVRLEDHELGNALSGRQPRYCHIPALDGSSFADLTIVATIHKDLALRSVIQRGVDQENQRERDNFSRAVARRFDRFAFPDEVVPWIKPLQDLFRSKADNQQSPLHVVVRQIEELRLEAVGGWRSEGPFDLVLIVVVGPGVLPEIEDLEVDIDSVQSPSQTATQWPGTDAAPAELVSFWEIFARSLELTCKPPKGSPKSVQDAVRSLTVEVVCEDDLTYQRVRRSAEIDLDHLSEPVPS